MQTEHCQYFFKRCCINGGLAGCLVDMRRQRCHTVEPLPLVQPGSTTLLGWPSQGREYMLLLAPSGSPRAAVPSHTVSETQAIVS